MEDGQKLEARNLRIKADSISWISLDNQKTARLPAANVTEIKFVRKGKGALEGMGLGLIYGAVFGAGLGLAQGDDNEGSWFRLSAGQKAALLGITFGGAGFLAGLPIGTIAGSKDIYYLEQKLPKTKLSNE